jgi:hypothetical protein
MLDAGTIIKAALELANSVGMEINAEWVVSTAHITANTDRWLYNNLEADPSSVIHVESTEYGWRIRVTSNPKEYDDTASGCPLDLTFLVDVCREAGIKWLLLDSGGPEVEGLQRYDW